MNRALQTAAAGAWSAFFVGVGVALAPMAIRSDGLRFPDGTVQTTAAAATIEAHPQHCGHPLTITAGETLVLSCFSHHPGDTTWAENGVPAGHYFVVTDVLLDPSTNTTDTGDVGFTLWHSSDCTTGTPGNFLSRSFRVVPDLQTTVWSFRAPMMILAPGHCLRVTGDIGITVAIEVDVTGYLTTNPELLGP